MDPMLQLIGPTAITTFSVSVAQHARDIRPDIKDQRWRIMGVVNAAALLAVEYGVKDFDLPAYLRQVASEYERVTVQCAGGARNPPPSSVKS